MMLNKSLKDALFDCSLLVQKKIDELLPQDFSDSKLVEAMRYSTLSEGKRIRPFMTMVAAQIFGIPPQDSLNAAIAIELIHTYSLIHDDLPAMDDDDLRRGRPTCHKKFDEATAILAGDGLLTYAFELLADEKTCQDANIRCELIKTIAKASGFLGMVGGQMIDLEKANKKISAEELTKLHRLKTGQLFVASVEVGAILGGGDGEKRKSLRHFAHDFGLLFQIKDDLSDHLEGNIETAKNFEASIVATIGIKKAKQQLQLIKNQTVNHLQIFGDSAKLLKELTEFVA